MTVVRIWAVWCVVCFSCPLILLFCHCLLLSSYSGQNCWVKLVSLTDQPLLFIEDCPTVQQCLSSFLSPLRPQICNSSGRIFPVPSTSSAPWGFNDHQDALSSPICPNFRVLRSDLLSQKWGGLIHPLPPHTPPHPLCPVTGWTLTLSWNTELKHTVVCHNDSWFHLYTLNLLSYLCRSGLFTVTKLSLFFPFLNCRPNVKSTPPEKREQYL